MNQKDIFTEVEGYRMYQRTMEFYAESLEVDRMWTVNTETFEENDDPIAKHV